MRNHIACMGSGACFLLAILCWVPSTGGQVGKPNQTWVPLQQFVDSANGTTCLTVHGGMGGLSNTMGFINNAMQASLNAGIEFKFPSIEPPEHGIRDQFEHVFGRSEKCNRTVMTHTIGCDFAIPRKGKGNFFERGYASPANAAKKNEKKARCEPSQYVVASAANHTRSNYCSCNRLLLLSADKTTWMFNYEKTGPHFREAFWAANPSKFKLPGTGIQIPGSTPISVVMHVRLGDVGGQMHYVSGRSGDRVNCAKHVPAIFFVNALKALEQVLPNGTMRVIVITESPKHEDIRQIETAARDEVIIQHSSAHDDLFSMVYSDILIIGGSGFGRFAAILQSQIVPSFRIALNCTSHSLTYVHDTAFDNGSLNISLPLDSPALADLIRRAKR